MVSLIVGLMIFGILKKPTGEFDAGENSDGEPRKFNFWFFLLLAALGVIAWLYFRGDTKTIVPTMSPDDFTEILKERLIKKEGHKGYYDADGNLQFAPGTVEFNDQRPFVPAGTGQEYLIQEIMIKDPESFDEPQSRVVMTNLNRDKKLIHGGLFAFHEHTTLFEWLKQKSFLKKLPLSSPESEGLQLAQFAVEQDIELGEIQRMRGVTRQRNDYGFDERGYGQQANYPGMDYQSGEEQTEDDKEDTGSSGLFGNIFSRRRYTPSHRYRRRR